MPGAGEDTPVSLAKHVPIPSLGAQLDAYEESHAPAEEFDPETEQRVYLLASVVAGIVAALVLSGLTAVLVAVL